MIYQTPNPPEVLFKAGEFCAYLGPETEQVFNRARREAHGWVDSLLSSIRNEGVQPFRLPAPNGSDALYQTVRNTLLAAYGRTPQAALASAQGPRESQQDRALIAWMGNAPDRTPALLIAVADGMGGHSRGEDAAQAAIDYLGTWARACAQDWSKMQDPTPLVEGLIRGADLAARRARGGTTLSLAIWPIGTATVTFGFAGDSPIRIVGVDGATVWSPTPHGFGSRLYNGLGTPFDEVHPEVHRRTIEPGQRIIISSDGVDSDVGRRLNWMLDTVEHSGETRDNATMVVAGIPHPPWNG